MYALESAGAMKNVSHIYSIGQCLTFVKIRNSACIMYEKYTYNKWSMAHRYYTTHWGTRFWKLLF